MIGPPGGKDAVITSGSASREVERTVISIALVADPDLPAEIAEALADQLPDVLAERIDPGVRWVVSVRREPLPAHETPEDLIEAIRQLLAGERWDLMICLTDLPLEAHGHPVVAEASADQTVGLISLPALGPAQALERTRDLMVSLIGELLDGREDLEVIVQGPRPAWNLPTHHLRRESSSSGVRFVASPARGTVLLLAGMVRANRPWRLVLGLLGALTAAVATAALANLNITVWRVASALNDGRLLLLMITSLGTMVVWLLLVHKLWRRPSAHMTRQQATLFNATTVFTLLIGVGTLYVGLFVFNVITGTLVIDSRPLREALGHRVGVADHLRLAWFISSVATVGGALGSGLESNEAVRMAAYRYQPKQSDD